MMVGSIFETKGEWNGITDAEAVNNQSWNNVEAMNRCELMVEGVTEFLCVGEQGLIYWAVQMNTVTLATCRLLGGPYQEGVFFLTKRS